MAELKTPLESSRRVATASRDAGAHRGVLAEWRGPRVTGEESAKRERITAQRRAADLAANDWFAESMLSAFAHNVVGPGLTPSARIPADQLGITPEQAAEIGKKFEWLFCEWSASADVRGGLDFGGLQALGLRTMLSAGEMLHIPVMLPDADRAALGLRFSLALQPVSPLRLRTPADLKADPSVRDGIRFSAYGRPLEYMIASPKRSGDQMLTELDEAAPYVRIPARVGRRPGIFHLFTRQEDEQIRGASVFSNSMNLFRLLDDSIANELATQVLSSKFAIWIQRDATLSGVMPVGVEQGGSEPGSGYTYLDGASVYYGSEGEKPEVLESNRPSGNVQSFWKIIMQAIASSAGLPYIAVSKDFSEVNYSSARAAMNEAWRVYKWYRAFLAERYCRPVWEMVVEEAVLRGLVAIPGGIDAFEAARGLWTACEWNGPARGYVDPTKEVQAEILAIDNKLKTRHQSMAEAGRDFDDELPVLRAEDAAIRALTPPAMEPKKVSGMTEPPQFGAPSENGAESPAEETAAPDEAPANEEEA